jgi:hypothetical protein
MKNEKKEKQIKSRYWTCILYPDSMMQNWQDILDNQCISWICSPLHDKDLDTDGKLKKAHYHLIYAIYENGSSEFSLAKKINESIKAFGNPEPVKQKSAMFAYLTHENQKDKYHYSRLDITHSFGIDLTDFEKLSKDEEDKIFDEIENFMDENCIGYYNILLKIVKENNNVEWKRFIRSHPYHFINYAKSITAYLNSKLEK